MTVFVDDMQMRATVGTLDAVWSHLMADTTEELLAFAARLGLRAQWLQHPGRATEHFDVTTSVRARALRMGAVPIVYGHEGYALTEARRAGVPFDLAAYRLANPEEGHLF